MSSHCGRIKLPNDPVLSRPFTTKGSKSDYAKSPILYYTKWKRIAPRSVIDSKRENGQVVDTLAQQLKLERPPKVDMSDVLLVQGRI